MKILTIGDVTGEIGIDTVQNLLKKTKTKYNIDFTIVNGENCCGTGITPNQADSIFAYGADVITLGNHAFKNKSICSYLDDNKYILRPANLAPQSPGEGYNIYDVCGYRFLLINVLGRCDMQFGPDNPFLKIDNILKYEDGRYDFCAVEIHANATSEKGAMGFYLDGRCSFVYGTHTHVQTNDARINPKGTGFVSDIGMTGPIYSVLGVNPENSIALFRGDLTSPFQTATGPCQMSGAVFTVENGICTDIQLINER